LVDEEQARFEDPRELLGDRLRGIYRLLADHGEHIFGVGLFRGRVHQLAVASHSPGSGVATVMILRSP